MAKRLPESGYMVLLKNIYYLCIPVLFRDSLTDSLRLIFMVICQKYT